MAPKAKQAPTMDDAITARAEAYAAAEQRLVDSTQAFEQARQTYADEQAAAAAKMETAGTDLAVARVDRERMIREADQAFDEACRALAEAGQA